MTRARTLSRLANATVLTVDGSNNVGVGSTIPDAKLDVIGIVSATSFYGSGSNLTGVTASGLTGSPNITINNLVGVAATFSGVVTYEDVTNVDSLGIITARSYVSIADSIVHTGDINTSLRFPANDTFTVETAGSERLRIDSSGRLLVGATSEVTASNPSIQLVDSSTAVLVLARDDSSISAGNALGTIEMWGNDGGTYQMCASIAAQADGTHADNDKPSRLVFSTTVDGASSPTERLRLTSAGNVSIQNDSGKFTAGASDDFEIYHDGTDNVIATDGPNIRIGTSGETFAKFTNNGAAELYYDNSKKIETTSAGVTVTGGMVSTNEVYIKGTSASTQRYLNFMDDGASTYRAALRRDAWYLGTVVSGIGDVTPGSVNIKLGMNGDATFAGSVKIGGTAAANEIDEYEEGTWTANLLCSTGTFTSTTGWGKYTKIGNTVYVWFLVQGSNDVSATLHYLTGLPYTVGGVSSQYPGPAISNAYNVNLGVNGTMLGGYWKNSTTYLRFHSSGNDTDQLNPSVAAESVTIRGEGFYSVS